MANKFVVHLDKAPNANSFPKDYFPKGVSCVCRANDLMAFVESKGGMARIETAENFDPAEI